VKLLIDMNLSPEWVGILHEAGWETVHWSSVGEAGAEDAQIMAWLEVVSWCSRTIWILERFWR